MSVSDAHTTARRVTRTAEIDLATLSDAFPEGTTVEVDYRGNPNAYTIEVARNGLRYLIEGEGKSAELTGVFGDGEPEKPERVPDWPVGVLEQTCDVREVSVYR